MAAKEKKMAVLPCARAGWGQVTGGSQHARQDWLLGGKRPQGRQDTRFLGIFPQGNNMQTCSLEGDYYINAEFLPVDSNKKTKAKDLLK